MDNSTWRNYFDVLTEIEKYQKIVRRKHKKNKCRLVLARRLQSL